MKKQKFTWEEFKKGWSKNGMVISDTKENMLKFIKLAKENGIELKDNYMEYDLKNNVKELYFTNIYKTLNCNVIIEDGDIQYTLQEVLKDLNILPFIETGDVVKLRNGTICVMLSNAFLNLNDKIVEAKLEHYTDDYLDNNYGGEEFDIMKIKHNIDPFDYFKLYKIKIEWDWVREEEKEIKLEDLDPGTKVKYIYKDVKIEEGLIIQDFNYGDNLILSLEENGLIPKSNYKYIKILEIVEE